MEWVHQYGGACLALTIHGKVIAMITGPHPSGYALTISATSVTSMHATLIEAQAAGEAVGNLLHTDAAQSDSTKQRHLR